MVFGSGLAVELNGFERIRTAAPAELVAKCCAVAGFCVAVFARGDEERKCAVVVFSTFVEEAGGVTVCKVVLCERIAFVRESLEDMASLLQKIRIRSACSVLVH